MTWTYHTAERMGWSKWTRKRRRKFKKRYFKQHGRRFVWFVTEFVYLPMSRSKELVDVVFYKREPSPTPEHLPDPLRDRPT